MQSSGTSSSPSSGDSSRRFCICCHGRISSFTFYCHTYCSKCRGSDCDLDNKCDECMSWTKEEMEAYVKLSKSLSSKSKHCKSVAKPPSSPRSTAPSLNLDLDNRFASQTDSISQSVDSKIAAMSEGLLAKFSSMLGQFKLELSNPCLSAEQEVSGYTPCSGQSLPLRHPDRDDVHPRQFQGTTEGPMPCGSGYAHTVSVSESVGQR